MVPCQCPWYRTIKIFVSEALQKLQLGNRFPVSKVCRILSSTVRIQVYCAPYSYIGFWRKFSSKVKSAHYTRLNTVFENQVVFERFYLTSGSRNNNNKMITIRIEQKKERCHSLSFRQSQLKSSQGVNAINNCTHCCCGPCKFVG